MAPPFCCIVRRGNDYLAVDVPSVDKGEEVLGLNVIDLPRYVSIEQWRDHIVQPAIDELISERGQIPLEGMRSILKEYLSLSSNLKYKVGCVSEYEYDKDEFPEEPIDRMEDAVRLAREYLRGRIFLFGK